jgi:hypothetical protein
MLDELFRELKDKWETLLSTTKDWMSHFESKYSTGETSDSEAEVVKESMVKKKFVLESTDQELQNTKPDTDAGLLELASKVRTYLNMTDPLHQELTQYSQSDSTAQELAGSVQDAREVVSEQVIKIYQSTIVHSTGTTVDAGQSANATVESQPSTITAANQPVSATAANQAARASAVGQGHVPVAGSSSVGCEDPTLSDEDKDNVFWLYPLAGRLSPPMIDSKTITVTLKLLNEPLNQANDLSCLNELTVDTLEHDWDTGVTNLEDLIDASPWTGDLRVISVLQFVHDQLKTLNNNLLITVTQNERIEV